MCERYIQAAAKDVGIPLGLLYAVALTESGNRGRLMPYAMNIEGMPFLAKSRSEAVLAFQSALEDDKKLIDVGCMQINHYYHNSAFSSIDEMLDPQKNILYAAKFLKSLKQRHGSWTAAVARYHAGPNNKAAQRKYVCRVIGHMVATDFGSWTPSSEEFCRPLKK